MKSADAFSSTPANRQTTNDWQTDKQHRSHNFVLAAVVKVQLDARKRSSCTSIYWDPAFPHLKLNKKRLGAKTTCLEAQSWRTVPSPLIFHFKHCIPHFRTDKYEQWGQAPHGGQAA